MNAEVAIEVRTVTKSYATPAGETPVLRGVDLQVRRGELVAVVGRSGSGKTTLLNLLAGIDSPTSGEVWVAGTAVHTLGEAKLAAWRGRTVGLVFQFFQLLPTLTVAENVMLPMDFCGPVPPQRRRATALELLAKVGIEGHADKLPAALSGGQQQRAAIARALANDPPVLLADEPTGNLDSVTAAAVLDLFADLARAGKAVVVVTHERDMSGHAGRQVTLVDGRVSQDVAVAA